VGVAVGTGTGVGTGDADAAGDGPGEGGSTVGLGAGVGAGAGTQVPTESAATLRGSPTVTTVDAVTRTAPAAARNAAQRRRARTGLLISNPSV
jgi:hypothetical protein